MASGNKMLFICVSAVCLLAMLLGANPAHGAPSPPGNEELDTDEREVIIGLAEGIIRVAAPGLLFDGRGRAMGKRSNAELVNGLLGMRLGELAKAGRR